MSKGFIAEPRTWTDSDQSVLFIAFHLLDPVCVIPPVLYKDALCGSEIAKERECEDRQTDADVCGLQTTWRQ